MELIVGARDKQDLAKLDAFLSAYMIVPLRHAIGTRAYELLRIYVQAIGGLRLEVPRY